MSKNIPEIRFKGFTHAWEQRKLGELCGNFRSGKSITANNISHAGIYPVYGGNGMRGYTNDFTHEGNYVLIGRQGALCGNINTVEGKAYISEHAIAISENETSSLNYLEQLLKNLQLNQYSESSAQPGLSVDKLKKINVTVPAKGEQTSIGNFFRILDDAITLHEQKLEMLKELKKGYLQQMFPREGESVPRVRFAGYDGSWERRKLGDFGKATGGTSIESEFVENGKYKIISIGSYSEESKYTDQGLRANANSKVSQRILNKDDLTMILNDKTSTGRIIGRVLLIDEDDAYIYNQRTQRIELYKEFFDPQFTYQLLNADDVRDKIVRSAQGNTQIYVNWSEICKIEYLMPTDKIEQTAIGNFFYKFDEQISAQQLKLNQLQQLKSAYLQNMFI